jgi:hypothetical protein
MRIEHRETSLFAGPQSTGTEFRTGDCDVSERPPVRCPVCRAEEMLRLEEVLGT